MTADEKNRIRKSIRERITDLEKDIVQLEEAVRPVAPDNAYGRLSRMEAISSKAVFEAALIRKRADLRHYKDALIKIDSDKYGVCMECGKAIASERLIHIPHAEFCIDCAKT